MPLFWFPDTTLSVLEIMISPNVEMTNNRRSVQYLSFRPTGRLMDAGGTAPWKEPVESSREQRPSATHGAVAEESCSMTFRVWSS